MINGTVTQLMMETSIQEMQRGILPAAERRAVIERELAAWQTASGQRRGRAVAAWLGNRLVHMGEYLCGDGTTVAAPQV